MVTGFALAVAMVLVSVGLSLGMKGKMDVMVVLLALTALGILASLLPQVPGSKGRTKPVSTFCSSSASRSVLSPTCGRSRVAARCSSRSWSR